MKIEIIAIGNEVVTGFTSNTNAAYISQALFREGIQVSRHSTLPDESTTLRQGLLEALQRSDVVIATGGLGPTCDDLTREIAAEIFNSDFYFDEGIANSLRQRYGESFPTIQDQATIPTKAHPLPNSAGTAPGLVFRQENRILILLPGVPPEMQTMFSEQVLPYIKEAFAGKKRVFLKQLHFFQLPRGEASIDPLLRKLKEEHPDVYFGIYPSQGTVQVHLNVEANNEKEAERYLVKPYEAILKQFGNYAFESSTGKLENAVHEWFIKENFSLSIAESCTGGSLSSKLTRIPGASKYFLGSVVAYSNELKTNLLGVSPVVLEKHGAVSRETVFGLLQGVLEKTGSDFAVAVTGIAGPSGGTPDKPVGTIWGAVGHKNAEPHIWSFFLRGNRDMIIDRAVNTLYMELLKYCFRFKTHNSTKIGYE